MTFRILSALEQRAVTLGHDGYSLRQITDHTGLPAHRLRELFTAYPALRRLTCPEDKCGKHQDHPGHPRRGWIRIKAAGEQSTWFCSWRCALRYATAKVTDEAAR